MNTVNNRDIHVNKTSVSSQTINESKAIWAAEATVWPWLRSQRKYQGRYAEVDEKPADTWDVDTVVPCSWSQQQWLIN